MIEILNGERVVTRFSGDEFFLSNFHESSCIHDMVIYRSVEHAYQAAKSLDATARALVAAETTPGRAKHVGRYLSLRRDWESVKLDVMLSCVRSKFTVSLYLQDMLRATAPMPLVEGNHWGDTFWGAIGPALIGQNHLGRILEQVRAEVSR